MKLKDTIDIWLDKNGESQMAIFEFVSSPKNDIIADEFAFLLSHIPDDPEWNPFTSMRSENNLQKIKNLREIIYYEYPES